MDIRKITEKLATFSSPSAPARALTHDCQRTARGRPAGQHLVKLGVALSYRLGS